MDERDENIFIKTFIDGHKETLKFEDGHIFDAHGKEWILGWHENEQVWISETIK